MSDRRTLLKLLGPAPVGNAMIQPATSAAPESLRHVIIVYKTHFDIGYWALASDVVHEYRTSMMDRTLEAIEKYRTRPKNAQFVWTVPGWPLEQMLGPGQDPARKRAVEHAIRSGNLAVHALPFTTHTETLEIEDLVRGLGNPSRIARGYGLPLPRDAKMTDVPEHTWLPAHDDHGRKPGGGCGGPPPRAGAPDVLHRELGELSVSPAPEVAEG